MYYNIYKIIPENENNKCLHILILVIDVLSDSYKHLLLLEYLYK